MPYKSTAQMRKFFVMEANNELPEGTAREWARHTPDIKKLPDHVPEKKGFFAMTDPIAGLAKQAADEALIEKLAADTQITPDLVRHLADKINVPVNRFVKLAYADPADYTVFLKLMSGAVSPDALTQGAASGPLVKAAKASLQAALQFMKATAGAGASAVKNTGQRAYEGARGAKKDMNVSAFGGSSTLQVPKQTGGALGTSGATSGVGKALEKTPLGKSVAGRGATGTAAVGAAGLGANEAIPGNRLSSPPGGGVASGMANGAMSPPGQPQKPPAPAGKAPGGAPGAGGAPGSQSPPAPGAQGAGGMSGGQKALIAGGGLAAGALGVGALARNRKKKQVTAFDHQFAKDVMIRLVEKKSADLARKEAASTLIGYLDFVASKMATEKTASVRKLQAAVAEGKPLSHAIKLAYPALNGEQRGILAVDMVEKAAKYGKGKSSFDSGTGGMKVQHRASATCKPGEASSMMSKMGTDGFVKSARSLIQTIMKARGAAGLGVGALGLAGAGAAAGTAGRAMKQPSPGGQPSSSTLNAALKPK